MAFAFGRDGCCTKIDGGRIGRRLHAVVVAWRGCRRRRIDVCSQQHVCVLKEKGRTRLVPQIAAGADAGAGLPEAAAPPRSTPPPHRAQKRHLPRPPPPSPGHWRVSGEIRTLPQLLERRTMSKRAESTSQGSEVCCGHDFTVCSLKPARIPAAAARLASMATVACKRPI